MEVQEGKNPTASVTAETSMNMSDSAQTISKDKKVDNAAIAEDFHSNIPDVSSKDVNMTSSSNMNTEIMPNITSDLIMTCNISLSTTVVADETLQPTIFLGEETRHIICNYGKLYSNQYGG